MRNSIAAQNPKRHVKQLALTGLMTAVLCILGPIALTIPFSPVPISLGFLGIYFVCSVLGRKLGSLSVSVYLLLGLAGLPVFTNFTGGPGKLFGPTGGYLIGYVFMALVCGFFVDKSSGRLLPTLIGMGLGSLVSYLFGSAWLGCQQSIGFAEAFFLGVVPYVPFDLAKLIIGAYTGNKLRKRLLQAGLLIPKQPPQAPVNVS